MVLTTSLSQVVSLVVHDFVSVDFSNGALEGELFWLSLDGGDYSQGGTGEGRLLAWQLTLCRSYSIGYFVAGYPRNCGSPTVG